MATQGNDFGNFQEFMKNQNEKEELEKRKRSSAGSNEFINEAQ